jgi:5-amino-6-(5-phosphoribosylamino)uracil reductase
VDELRAQCDAILVGAGTIRADRPRLLVRSRLRQQQRIADGKRAQPIKATMTTSGNLDAGAEFFALGDSPKIVYCPGRIEQSLRQRLDQRAVVVGADGEAVDPRDVLADLAGRGVRRLLIEGGSSLSTLFLSAGLVSELRLAVAPFFVGQADAPRFVLPGDFPHGQGNRMTLQRVAQVGDLAVLIYSAQRSDKSTPESH